MKIKILLFATALSAGIAPGQTYSDFTPYTASGILTQFMNSKPALTSGAGSPSSNCTAFHDLYINSSNSHIWACTATNTWTDVTAIGGGGGGSPTTVNGQSCAAGGNCNVNIGATSGTFAINGGNGNPLTTGNLSQNGSDGSILGAKTIDAPGCSAQSNSGTLTIDLSASNCGIVTASGGNVTITVANPHGSGPFTLIFCNDSSPRTWTLPGTFKQIGTPAVALACYFNNGVAFDGTNYQGSGSNETPSISRFSALRSAPTQSGCGGGGCLWPDSTANNLHYYIAGAGANPFGLFLSGADCNPDTGKCTETNGVPFANSATTDATNASNITSGTLPPSQLPNSGVTANTYSNPTVTVDIHGRITAASNGASGGSANFPVNPQTSTYTVAGSDFSNCKNITVASGTFTITLVASGSQPAAGACIWVTNYGSGTVTVARSGQNINGGTSSLSLTPGTATNPTGAFIVSDGTNYFADVFGEVSGTSGVSAFNGRSGAVTPASGDYAATQVTNAVGTGCPDVVSTTDFLSNASLTVEQGFTSTCTTAGASTANTLDGYYKSAEITVVSDTWGTNSPTFTWKLKACSTALSGTPLTCPGTTSTLMSLGAAALNSGSNVASTISTFVIGATGTAGTFIVAKVRGSGSGNIDSLDPSAGVSALAANCAACTSGAYVLYWTMTFSATGSGSAACLGTNTGGTNCAGLGRVSFRFSK